MPSLEIQFSEAAYELESWYKSIVQLAENTIFAISQDIYYQDAIVLGILTENARTIYENSLDKEGKLYTPLCLMLAALAKKLGLKITPKHWKAAIENVYNLSRQLGKAQSEVIGIHLGTPATIFRSQLCEALGNAGLLTRPTNLNEENRRIAMGLSINWGIRFLIAYALETREYTRPSASNAHDLFWIGTMIQNAISYSSV